MFQHSFIFSPGTWIGEGKIILNMVEEELVFQTKWSVQGADFSQKVVGAQDIQVQGLSEQMRNELTFYDFKPKSFLVDMDNQNVGRIVGKGIYDEKMIAWEFRDNENFEGYETYTLQEDGSYEMKGEYITTDQFRTQIKARIWRQSNEVSSADESEYGGEEL